MRIPLFISALILHCTAPLVGQATEERLRKLETGQQELRETYGKEIERLQFGDFVPALIGGRFGMGPAASKVYGRKQGLSIGGYGEFLYQQRSGDTDVFDALRTVLYTGYRFDDRWLLNTELEFEHATTEDSSGTTKSGGSTSVEFSYLEYLGCDGFNVRGGLLLVPMGFINEMHEPTTYLPAQRPETERRIIPSTWRETGLQVHGSCGDVSYKSCVVTSLDGEKFTSAGLREGRQAGNRAAADDVAYVGRLDWRCCEGLTVGGSVFVGDTGQDGLDAKNNRVPSMRTTIAEAHAEYQAHGFVVRGLYASASLRDTATFNTNTGANVARRMEGYYGEIGYDVLSATECGQALLPYFRYERIDTQAEMSPGFARDRTRDDTVLTLGLHYRPIDQVVIKADFQSFDESDDRFEVSFGYVF